MVVECDVRVVLTKIYSSYVVTGDLKTDSMARCTLLEEGSGSGCPYVVDPGSEDEANIVLLMECRGNVCQADLDVAPPGAN